MAKDADSAPTPAKPPSDDLDELNRRIAEEAAKATTADKVNPK